MTSSGANIMAGVLTVLKWIGWGLLGIFIVFLIGLVLVPPATRSFTDRWGATDEEVGEVLPGDNLIDAKREISTHAVTIDAPPSVVYALLVQMGQRRAGWYGWDWFYDLTNSSDFVDGHYSQRIVAELQNLKVGDKIPINDAVSYTVTSLAPQQHLVLYVGSKDPYEMASGSWSANSMAFVIKALPNGRSRLLLRMRADGTDTGFARWVWNGPMNFGGALFGHKTIVGLRKVAEKIASDNPVALEGAQ